MKYESRLPAVGTLSAALASWWLSTSVIARPPDAFDACAREQAPAKRLACFDQALAARHAADRPPARSAPARKAATPRAIAAGAPIVARIVRVIPREPYIAAFELDNGQIWEQSETMNFSARPRDEVTIRRGWLGSFFLKNADGISVRVHRVK